jgi:hypothetical protein
MGTMPEVEFENQYSAPIQPAHQEKQAHKKVSIGMYIVFALCMIGLVVSLVFALRGYVSTNRNIETINPNDPQSLAAPEYVQTP